MALSKSFQSILPLPISILHEPYVTHKRYFAKAKQKEKSQSTLNQLQADKTTQQYSEILSWWNKTKKSRLDITSLPSELQLDFINKRQQYKELNIKRINKMKSNILISTKRKQEAIEALPPRLSFICKVSKEPTWKKDLSSTIHNTYHNLHHLHNSTETDTDIDNMNMAKLKYKEPHQIEALEHARMNNMKSYKFSTSPLQYFPPLYDPSDIRTQPAYVKSYFDYNWKPGTNIPVPTKGSAATSAIKDKDDNINIYGRDYSQLQLSKIINIESGSSGSIGGTQDLKKKLEAEEEANLTAQQKLERERGKKTAEARAQNNLRLEKIRQTKEKIKQSVKDWEKEMKQKANTDDKDVDDINSDKNQQTLKRIEEIEMLNEDLPKMEALLVDKELNKAFFEKKLPFLLNNELVDDAKKNECIVLIKKYHTLQKHVGYN